MKITIQDRACNNSNNSTANLIQDLLINGALLTEDRWGVEDLHLTDEGWKQLSRVMSKVSENRVAGRAAIPPHWKESAVGGGPVRGPAPR